MEYTELVNSLRICGSGWKGGAKVPSDTECCGCMYLDSENMCGSFDWETNQEKLLLTAADAIQELISDCDMHRKAMAYEHNRAAKLAWEKEHCWIPVTERLPEPGVPCLCWCMGGTYRQIRWFGLYYLTSHRTWAIYDNDYENQEVTHWMYRPEPPKEETE